MDSIWWPTIKLPLREIQDIDSSLQYGYQTMGKPLEYGKEDPIDEFNLFYNQLDLVGNKIRQWCR